VVVAGKQVMMSWQDVVLLLQALQMAFIHRQLSNLSIQTLLKLWVVVE